MPAALFANGLSTISPEQVKYILFKKNQEGLILTLRDYLPEPSSSFPGG